MAHPLVAFRFQGDMSNACISRHVLMATSERCRVLKEADHVLREDLLGGHTGAAKGWNWLVELDAVKMIIGLLELVPEDVVVGVLARSALSGAAQLAF